MIVGSVDGNRLWGKELNMPLRFVEWSPDSRFIMFVTLDAEVWIFDAEGAKVRSFTLVGQDHSSLGGDIGEAIVWFCYYFLCSTKITFVNISSFFQIALLNCLFITMFSHVLYYVPNIHPGITGIHWFCSGNGSSRSSTSTALHHTAGDLPGTLCIAFDNGKIQV